MGHNIKIDTNPSCFFRDKEVWDALREEIKTEYIKEYEQKETIKILCIGCSSGDEAYSISMLMRELNLPHEIDAVDIDKEKIDLAKKGAYPKESLENLSPALLRRYFNKLGSSYQIKQELFNINFMQKDAFEHLSETEIYVKREDIYPKNNYSIILCRSVFLMHNEEKADKLLNLIRGCCFLRGILVLSSDDKMPENIEKYFEVTHFNERIFRREYHAEILCEESEDSRNLPIKIIGFGGAGIQMVERLQEIIEERGPNPKEVKIIAADTNICPLKWVRVKNKIFCGRSINHYLGTGGKPEMGEASIKSSISAIERLVCFEKTKLLILVAGLGGGTGSSALAYVSGLAKENGIKVIAIFTKPLQEEEKRNEIFKIYLKKIYSNSDKIIILDLAKMADFCKKERKYSFQIVFWRAKHIMANLVVQELLNNNPNYSICEVILDKKDGIMNMHYNKLNIDRTLNLITDNL